MNRLLNSALKKSSFLFVIAPQLSAVIGFPGNPYQHHLIPDENRNERAIELQLNDGEEYGGMKFLLASGSKTPSNLNSTLLRRALVHSTSEQPKNYCNAIAIAKEDEYESPYYKLDVIVQNFAARIRDQTGTTLSKFKPTTAILSNFIHTYGQSVALEFVAYELWLLLKRSVAVMAYKKIPYQELRVQIQERTLSDILRKALFKVKYDFSLEMPQVYIHILVPLAPLRNNFPRRNSRSAEWRIISEFLDTMKLLTQMNLNKGPSPKYHLRKQVRRRLPKAALRNGMRKLFRENTTTHFRNGTRIRNRYHRNPTYNNHELARLMMNRMFSEYILTQVPMRQLRYNSRYRRQERENGE